MLSAFAWEQVGVDKVVPFLLPGRPGEYLVEVLSKDEGVLASQSVVVASQSAEESAPDPLCIDPEVDRLYAEAMQKASELVLGDDRETASALLEDTAKEVELSYPGHGTERVARLRAMRETLQQHMDNSLPARMLSIANTVRNDSLASEY